MQMALLNYPHLKADLLVFSSKCKVVKKDFKILVWGKKKITVNYTIVSQFRILLYKTVKLIFIIFKRKKINYTEFYNSYIKIG